MMSQNDKLYLIICEQEENFDMEESCNKAKAIVAGTQAESNYELIQLKKQEDVSIYKTI